MNPVAVHGARPFGKYQPIAVLGRGGMATVYLAVAQGPANFTKLVVVKEILPELAQDAEVRAMFLDEARLAARLSHPNIVQTYEVLDDDDRHVIIMEYLEGQPLTHVSGRLVSGGSLPTSAVARIVADVLGGLHYAHELADFGGQSLDVVHRDISPHNIFVTYAGEAKIVDFGIAKATDSLTKTRIGVVKGKMGYMAPEQAMGRPVDRRADVFSVGVVLWEAFAGRRFWRAMTENEIREKLIAGDLPVLKNEALLAVPEPIERACARALAVRPEDRYPTAAAFQADLERYLKTLGMTPSARDVGALLARAFDDDRRRMRALIEEQVSGERAARTSGAPRPLAPEFPANATRSSRGETGAQRHATASQPPGLTTTGRTDFGAAARRASMSNTVWLFVGALALAAMAFVFVRLRSSGQRDAAAAGPRPAAGAASDSAVASTVSAPSPHAASGVAAVVITLSAKPDGARLFLDGAPLATNPFTASFQPGSGAHVVRAEAAGHTSREERVVFDANRSIAIALPPRGMSAPHRAPAAAAPPPTHRAPEVDIGYLAAGAVSKAP